MHRRFVFALVVALVLGSRSGRAQENRGFSLGRFQPSERGSSWFALDSLDFRGGLRPAVGLTGDYAHKPLVIRAADGTEQGAIVEQQTIMHAGASLVVIDRFRIGMNVPLVAHQGGDAGAAAGQSVTGPSSSAALGDLRLTADVRAFGSYGDVVTGAFGIETYLPTGSPSAYTGDGSVRAIPRILVAGKAGMFEYAGRLGVHIRGSGNFAGSDRGPEAILGAAAGVRPIRRLLVGPEIFGATTLGSDEGSFRTRNTPLEALMGGHYDITDELHAGLGIGAGVTRGYGSPQFRGVLTFEWTPSVEHRAPRDQDGDGVPDKYDACVDVPGPVEMDGCPYVHEVASAPPPPPIVEEPPPRDQESVAVVRGGQIRLREPIRFHFDSVELDPAGIPILEAVRRVLLEHDIHRVRIEGHTDAIGSAEYNVRLSEARARAVRDWLVMHGIDESRLVVAGVGPHRPITDNETDAGRRTNRRVEFHIVEKGDLL